MFIEPQAFLDIFHTQARDASVERVAHCRDARFLREHVTAGAVEMYTLASPPGAGSITTSRALFEKGAFDAWLIEPAGRIERPQDGFAATMRDYKATIKAVRTWDKRLRGTPIKILVTEKSQHHAPGAEMDFMSKCAKHTAFLIRNPEDCMAKALRITALLLVEHTKHLPTFAALVQQGYLYDDSDLRAAVEADTRSLPVGEKAYQAMVSSRNYEALTEQAWFLGRGMYETRDMQHDASLFRGEAVPGLSDGFYASDAWKWCDETFSGDYGRSLNNTQEVSYRNVFGKRIAGWDALWEYCHAISKTAAEHTGFCDVAAPSVFSFEHLQTAPEQTIHSLLESWNVPLRTDPVHWSDRHVHCPYGKLEQGSADNELISRVFGKALFEPLAIEPKSSHEPPVRIPEFLKSEVCPVNEKVFSNFCKLQDELSAAKSHAPATGAELSLSQAALPPLH